MIECIRCRHYTVGTNARGTKVHKCAVKPFVVVLGQLQGKINDYCGSFEVENESKDMQSTRVSENKPS